MKIRAVVRTCLLLASVACLGGCYANGLKDDSGPTMYKTTYYPANTPHGTNYSITTPIN